MTGAPRRSFPCGASWSASPPQHVGRARSGCRSVRSQPWPSRRDRHSRHDQDTDSGRARWPTARAGLGVYRRRPESVAAPSMGRAPGPPIATGPSSITIHAPNPRPVADEWVLCHPAVSYWELLLYNLVSRPRGRSPCDAVPPVCAFTQFASFNTLRFPMVDLGVVGTRWVRRRGERHRRGRGQRCPESCSPKTKHFSPCGRPASVALIPGDLRYGPGAVGPTVPGTADRDYA
jgi:hypothetical protein